MQEPELRTISPKQFLMIDGQGEPDDAMAYASVLRNTIKAMGLKPGLFEALWWSEGGAELQAEDPQAWRWTFMTQPSGHPTADVLAKAVSAIRAEQPGPLLDKIRLETFDEGQVVQILFAGSPQDKQPKLEAMLAYALAQGLKPKGKYHEIYIDDPGPEAPFNAQTVLRQPVQA